MKPEKIIYAAEVTALGGRVGRATSSNGVLDVSLTVPKELGGTGDTGTNPEQLFAAGYAACFLSALKLMGRQRKVALSEDTSVTATVGVGSVSERYVLTVELRISIPGLDPAVAEELVAGAHERCPYSNATRGNIDVALTIV